MKGRNSGFKGRSDEMHSPNRPRDIAGLLIGGAFATAAWWLECSRWHLPETDGAKWVLGPLLVLHPVVFIFAAPVSLASAAGLFPIAYPCLKHARLRPSAALLAAVVGVAVVATVEVAARNCRLDVMSGYLPVYPAAVVGLVACRFLFSVHDANGTDPHETSHESVGGT